MQSSNYRAQVLAAFFLSCLNQQGCIASGDHVCGQSGTTPPPMTVLKELNSTIPNLKQHEIRVFKATVKPREVSIWHTHHSPPIVYVISGTFQLELKGKEPLILKAGESLAEPVSTVMRACNPSDTVDTEIVIVQIADPLKPFLDPVEQ